MTCNLFKEVGTNFPPVAPTEGYFKRPANFLPARKFSSGSRSLQKAPEIPYSTKNNSRRRDIILVQTRFLK